MCVHELSSGSVHFLFAVLRCEIIFLLQFVISTVIQLSDMHSIQYLFSCAFCTAGHYNYVDCVGTRTFIVL